jgi:hypothetical protein
MIYIVAHDPATRAAKKKTTTTKQITTENTINNRKTRLKYNPIDVKSSNSKKCPMLQRASSHGPFRAINSK